MTHRTNASHKRRCRWRGLPFALAMSVVSMALAAAAPPPEIDPAVVEALAKTMAEEVNQSDRFDAQVWLLSSAPKVARYVPAEAERTSILKSVYREANRQKMDPDLVLALMHVESRF